MVKEGPVLWAILRDYRSEFMAGGEGGSDYPIRLRIEERLKHRPLDRDNQTLGFINIQRVHISYLNTYVICSKTWESHYKDVSPLRHGPKHSLNPRSSDRNHLSLFLAK